MGFVSFGSIEQFRHAIRGVSMRASYTGKDADGQPIYDGTRKKPTLKYRGTVKLHGSNAAIQRLPSGEILLQKRSGIVGKDGDSHYGFRNMIEAIPPAVIENLFSGLVALANGKPTILFGEIAGGNVQKRVALVELEKFFAIFAAAIIEDDGSRTWIDMATLPKLPASPEHRIFNVLQPEFPKWELEIDFEKPGLVQNKLVEITKEVEKECPFAKAFGVSGIGEGVVWQSITPGWMEQALWFKVKGDEHSSSKVKTLAEVDVEKLTSLYAFADKVMTLSRLEQGVQFLRENNKPVDRESTGDYVRWCVNDVIKEEKDTMEASGLEERDVGKAVGTHASKWFFQFLEKNDKEVLNVPTTESLAVGDTGVSKNS